MYTAGKSADYFIMILEGRVQVIVGSENLIFDAGPFTYFGTPALRLTAQETSMLSKSSSSRPPTPDSPGSTSTNQEKDLKHNSIQISNNSNVAISFIPDYTVKIIETIVYMKITRNVYLAAYKASQMERKKEWSQDDDKLKKEIDTAFTSSLGVIGSDTDHREAHIYLSSTEEKRNSKSSKIGLKTSSPAIKRGSKASLTASSPLSSSTVLQSRKSVTSENVTTLETPLKDDSHFIQMP